MRGCVVDIETLIPVFKKVQNEQLYYNHVKTNRSYYLEGIWGAGDEICSLTSLPVS